MSEHAPSSPSPYDLSEAALKELYLDRDEDDNDIANLLGKADEPRVQGPAEPPRGDSEAAPRLAPAADPSRAEVRALVKRPEESAEKTNPRRKIIGVVLAALGVLLIVGWAFYRPARTPFTADAAKKGPTIVTFLRVADLAAGRKINPGETYGVDLPVGKVRIAVVAGEVALKSRSGESLRACSNQPFVVDVSSGSDNSAHPFVSACGREASFVQAEIPPPPLPSPAPVAAITPSMFRAGGD